MISDLESLMDDLEFLLDIDADSLEERKAFPVGTKRTWAAGIFKKSKHGWIRISSKKSTKSKKSGKTGKKKAPSVKPTKSTAKLKKLKPAPLKPAQPAPVPIQKVASRAAPGEVREWSAQVVNYQHKVEKNVPKYREIGLTEDEAVYASTVVASWADMVYMPGAASLRGAVSSALGIKLLDEKNLLNRSAWHDRSNNWVEKSMNALESAYKGEAPPPPDVVKKSIAKMAKASQKAYKEDPVTLYRGVGKSNAEDAIKSGKLAVASLSSWSESRAIAAQFAEDGGKVMKVKVPRASIMMSHRVCPGLLVDEQEVVLAVKGAIKCEVLHESKDSELEGEFHEVELEGVTLKVPNESTEGAADGYDDWLADRRKANRG